MSGVSSRHAAGRHPGRRRARRRDHARGGHRRAPGRVELAATGRHRGRAARHDLDPHRTAEPEAPAPGGGRRRHALLHGRELQAAGRSSCPARGPRRRQTGTSAASSSPPTASGWPAPARAGTRTPTRGEDASSSPRTGSSRCRRTPGPEGEAFRGEAPAWRPDGTLTYFARGAVREWPSGNVVLSQRSSCGLSAGVRFRGLPASDGPACARPPGSTAERLAAILSVDGPSGSVGRARRPSAREAPGGLPRHARPLPRPARQPCGHVLRRPARAGPALIMVERGRGELAPPGNRRLPVDRLVARRGVGRGRDAAAASSSSAPAGPDHRSSRSTSTRATSTGAARPVAGARRRGRGAGVAGTRPARPGGWSSRQAEGSGCALRALRLPDLTWADAAARPAQPCRFRLDDSGAVLPEDVVPQPGGDETMTCRGIEDCSVAWMPDGRPAYVAGGELFAGTARREAQRAAPLERRPPPPPRPPVGARGGLLGRRRALLGDPSVGLDGERRVDDRRQPRLPALVHDADDRRAARGRDGDGRGPDRPGRGLLRHGPPPRAHLPDGRAVAWAPGEPLAAVATSNGIVFVAPETGESVVLPYPVRDLEWVVP